MWPQNPDISWKLTKADICQEVASKVKNNNDNKKKNKTRESRSSNTDIYIDATEVDCWLLNLNTKSVY